MQTLSSFRKSLGISQRQLAAFIGGDRTQLVRAEQGERNLSASAAIHFTALLPAWQTAMQATVPVAESSVPDEIPDWQLQAMQCRRKARTIQRQLADLQAGYIAGFRLDVFCQQVLQSNTTLSEKQQRWLEERQYEAQVLLKETHQCREKTLRLQMAAVEAEAAIYENAIQEAGNLALNSHHM